MEIIDAIVAQETGDFNEAFMAFIDADLTADEVMVQTGKIEEMFLAVKDARQKWHGAAYNKLTTDKEKKAYVDLYGLTDRTVQDWALTVKNWFTDNALKGGLTFTHYKAANSLAKVDKPLAIEFLDEAEKSGQNAVELGSKCSGARQQILRDIKIARVVEKKGISISKATKLVDDSDAAAQSHKAAITRRKAYDKAKKTVEEFEASPAVNLGERVSRDEAMTAAKTLFINASKHCHADKGGTGMDLVNAANADLKKFINYWI